MISLCHQAILDRRLLGRSINSGNGVDLARMNASNTTAIVSITSPWHQKAKSEDPSSAPVAEFGPVKIPFSEKLQANFLSLLLRCKIITYADDINET